MYIYQSLFSSFGLQYKPYLLWKHIILLTTRINNSTGKHRDGFYNIALFTTWKIILISRVAPSCSRNSTCNALSCCSKQTLTRKTCFRYLKLMSSLNIAICTTISNTLWVEWYYLKNNYLTLRSKVKVPQRSLWYATHRLMVMHLQITYNKPIWKDKKVMVRTSFAEKKPKQKKRKKKSD